MGLVGVEEGDLGRGLGRGWEDVGSGVVGEGGSCVGGVSEGKGGVGEVVCVVPVLSIGLWVIRVEYGGCLVSI